MRVHGSRIEVTFTASTGECVPADGVACLAIPTGPEVLVQMFDADAPATALDFSPIEISAGEQYFFYTDLDDAGPIWMGNTIKQDVATCEEFTYADVP